MNLTLEKLQTDVTAYLRSRQEKDNKLIDYVANLSIAASTGAADLKTFVNEHLAKADSERNQLTESVSSLTAAVSALNSKLDSTTTRIDTILDRADKIIADNDKKGEEQRRRKEKKQTILSSDFGKSHGVPVAPPQCHDVKGNPYNLSIYDLSNYDIHQDARYKAHLERLTPAHKELYDELLNTRRLYVLGLKKEEFQKHYGSRKNFSAEKEKEILRDIPIGPVQPIWLYPFPHIKFQKIPLSHPAPAPFHPEITFESIRKEASEELRARLEKERLSSLR